MIDSSEGHFVLHLGEQYSFPGFGEVPRQEEGRLFFAVFLDRHTAASVSRVANGLRRDHGLTGRPLQTERFHVTLHYLGQYSRFPDGIVRTACEAAATFAMPPFDVAFDRVASFDNRPFNRPLVLLNSGGDTALRVFRRTLGVALAKKGLSRADEEYWNPHVTLLYDDRHVAEHAVDTIRWTVQEFVLVHSLVGQTLYIPLGRWPLTD